MNVYLLTHKSQRELDSYILLATALLARGLSPFICKDDAFIRNSGKVPRGIVLQHSPGRHLAKGYGQGSNGRHIIATLNHEVTNAHVLADLRGSKNGTLATSDVNFCLGQYDYQRTEVELPRGSTITTSVSGNPRFDLLSSIGYQIYGQSIGRLHDHYGSFILCTPSDIVGKGTDGKEDAVRGQRLLTDAIEIARLLPDQRVVVRVRGSTRNPEQSLIKSLLPQQIPENFALVSGGSITPWVLASEGVIHDGSTAGSEGFLAGKRTVFYMPSGLGQADLRPSTFVSDFASDIEEVVELLDSSSNSSTAVDLRLLAKLDGLKLGDWPDTKKDAGLFFFGHDGEVFSVDKIADTFARQIDGNVGVEPLKLTRSRLGVYPVKLAAHSKRLASTALDRTRLSSRGAAVQGVSLRHVRQFLRKISDCRGSARTYGASEIGFEFIEVFER